MSNKEIQLKLDGVLTVTGVSSITDALDKFLQILENNDMYYGGPATTYTYKEDDYE